MSKHPPLLLLFAVSAGCAADLDGELPEGELETVEQEAAVCYTVGDTFQGYPLFSPNCNAGTTDFWTGNGITGGSSKQQSSWVRTGWQWQCMEWAIRYFHFAKKVPESIWDGVPSAKLMCERASANPSYVQRLSSSTTVKVGDLVVYDSATTPGHVAVVGAVSADNASVLTYNQNTRATSGAPLYRWWRPRSAAKCYIRAAVQQATTCGPTPFTDICTSSFKPDIEWLYASGITNGCSATKYCPAGLVTRGQMAAFLTRAYGYPSTSTNYFTDDNGHELEGSINAIRKAGITYGCGGTSYCPDDIVTRGQMAAFMARAENLSAGATIDYFSDDNGHQFEAQLNMARHAGIFLGCGSGKACPDASVTREQMAAFLHRADP
jgi:hypothetical protein